MPAPSVPAFLDAVSVATNALVASGLVIVSGAADVVWPATVRGEGSPQMRVNAGDWGTNGFIIAGDAIELRMTSSALPLTARTATLRAQGLSVPWVVTTRGILQPSDVSDLRAWWDASTLTGPDGTTVSSLLDRSGNAKHATRESGTLPTMQTRNGLRVMRLIGTDFLTAPNSLAGATNATAFVVSYRSGAGFFSALGSASGGYSNVEFVNSGSVNYAAFYSTAGRIAGDAPTSETIGAWNIQQMRRSGAAAGNLTFRKNGGSATANNGATIDGIGNGSHTLGAYGASGYVGDFGEALIYGRALSDAEIEQVEGYLAHKWNLTALIPSGHPYKATAP